MSSLHYIQKKRLLIGLIGIGGCGKTTFKKEMLESEFYKESGNIYCTEIRNTDLMFCDPPTIEKYMSYSKEAKRKFHNKGLSWLKEKSENEDKHIILLTHYSYTRTNIEQDYFIVMSDFEKDFFDLIVYLDYDPKNVHERQVKDKIKIRGLSLEKVIEWSKFEKENVKKLFKNTKIIYLKEDTNILSFFRNYFQEHDQKF